MIKFFRQFGNVVQARLQRSKRTGNSCGFGFVQFEEPEIAMAVNELMNGYLLYNKIIKSEVLEKVPENFWKRFYVGQTEQQKCQEDRNKPFTEEEFNEARERIKNNMEAIQKKLDGRGIKYRVPEVQVVDIE